MDASIVAKVKIPDSSIPVSRNLEDPRPETEEEKDNNNNKEVEMKRRREMEKQSSEIRSAIEELSMLIKLKPNIEILDAAHIPTKPFLLVCNLVLQVLDKIGPTMLVLRQDIHQNIERLEKFCESDPSKYANVVEILKKEASEGNAKKKSSCGKAFLWLTRSLDFKVALLQRLAKDPGQKMEQAVEESYNVALKPWHGWISSAAFKVALKLVPDSVTFMNILLAKDETYDTLKEEMQTLTSLLVPFLEENHSILRLHGLDTLKSK